ncbi:carbon-nitrogen family hydrolase [Bacillus sp. BGMRC 2118]|nr:carbon-nitrogen family hydrolase [Bacillus sp. BGMRC 2118]
MSIKVSCVQFDIQFGNPQENYRIVKHKLSEAMMDKPDIIVLPELWTTGYDLTRLSEIADSNDETVEFLSAQAKEHNVYIVGGSIAKKTPSGVYNTMFAISNKGELLGEYSKLHLFKLMDEHLYLEAGESEGNFEIANTQCAGVICYDIRFPEWIRKHTTNGAEVLFVVAEWPLPRLSHWRSLLISRAIENQCYVIACNRSGQDPNNVFAGHSMIIDPWGEVLAEAGEEESIIQADLDIEKVRTVRKHIPIFDDRRPELY